MMALFGYSRAGLETGFASATDYDANGDEWEEQEGALADLLKGK